jgi:hypothetical protein
VAHRYSGNLTVACVYRDATDDYRCVVSERGKRGHITIHVKPPAAGYGAGVAYDSPLAYDQVARAAISFADDEGFDVDGADTDDRGFVIHRSASRSTTREGGGGARGNMRACGSGGSKAQDARDVQDVKRILTLPIQGMAHAQGAGHALREAFPAHRHPVAYVTKGKRGGPFRVHWDVIEREPVPGALRYSVGLEPIFKGGGVVDLVWTWWRHDTRMPHINDYVTSMTANDIRDARGVADLLPSELRVAIARSATKRSPT